MSAANSAIKEERKQGIVRKIARITFTVGPIRQEDLSSQEINKLMAMAESFDINFKTVPILDSEKTDKLGYITLPFEIRTQEYLLVLYDRLTNLKLSSSRDVSVRFPVELKKYVEDVRREIHQKKKLDVEEEKKAAEKRKRSLYATYVDKDTGRDMLVERFPEAKEVVVRQHNFQWFGCMEFESADKALQVLKLTNVINVDGQTVKIVRVAPDQEEQEAAKAKSKAKAKKSPKQQSQKRPHTAGPGGRQGQQNSPIEMSRPRSDYNSRGHMGMGMSGMSGYGRGYGMYAAGYGGGFGDQGFHGPGSLYNGGHAGNWLRF